MSILDEYSFVICSNPVVTLAIHRLDQMHRNGREMTGDLPAPRSFLQVSDSQIFPLGTRKVLLE